MGVYVALLDVIALPPVGAAYQSMVIPVGTVAARGVLVAPKQMVSPTGDIGAAMGGQAQLGAVTGNVISQPVVGLLAVKVTLVPEGIPITVFPLIVPAVLDIVPLLVNEIV